MGAKYFNVTKTLLHTIQAPEMGLFVVNFNDDKPLLRDCLMIYSPFMPNALAYLPLAAGAAASSG